MTADQPLQIGVSERAPAADEIDQHLEAVRLAGYTVVPSVMPEAALTGLRQALDQVYARQAAEFGGVAALASIDEADTIRAPLVDDPMFLDLAIAPKVLELCTRLLDGYVVLNQQNGIIAPPERPHHQMAWHRDLPYQHFTSSRPLAVAALFCLDAFTPTNGATLIVPGSHRMEAFPSAAALDRFGISVAAPAGSTILFDAMVYHRTGDNRSDSPRRAVNHVYTRAFIRQQIDLPAALGGRYRERPELARLLGYDTVSAPSALDWRRSRLAPRPAGGIPGDRPSPIR
jgi:ectoine hydroxylase-related dioxygenase (phytanoyl-CoA dioxygenase family)